MRTFDTTIQNRQTIENLLNTNECYNSEVGIFELKLKDD